MAAAQASAPEFEVPRASMRRRLRLLVQSVRRGERRLLVLVAAMLVADSAAVAVQGLSLKWLVDAAIGGRSLAAAGAAVLCGLGTAGLALIGRVLNDVPILVARRVGFDLDEETLQLTAALPGIEHLENARFQDEVSLLKRGGPQLVRTAFSIGASISSGARIVLAVLVLVAVDPWLVLLPLAAVPSILLVPRAQRHVDRADAAAAEHARAAGNLHKLFTQPVAAMEMRVFGAAEALDRRASTRWRQAGRVVLNGAIRSIVVSVPGWLILTLGYVGALLFVARQAVLGRATAGDVVLVSHLGLQLRAHLMNAANVTRGAAGGLRMADRFLWLADLAEEQAAQYSGRRLPPSALSDGIRLEHVSFTYPGTSRPVLVDVSLDLPAGMTVAVVGENGAGKSSLVKLLAGLYRPTSGRILVDGTDLDELDVEQWRARLAAGFQDFVRLEAPVRHSVGVGEISLVDHEPHVRSALAKGDALRLVEALPDGLETHVGKTYRAGAELSGGQWQRLAIARAMMRERPLCLILDEPTSALDAAAEHALYERYSGAAQRTRAEGGVTLLISHRFSSVRMADLIVVLEGGRVTECGQHSELLAAGKTYATMYRQQADAYR